MQPESPILSRILRSLGPDGNEVFARLCSLSPRDLQSLLLALHAERAARRGQNELSADFARLPLLQPGPVDPRLSQTLSDALFRAAAAFEAVELSPLLPFAATHRLGRVHQNNVLTATRSSELVADPSTALALIAAQRRKTTASRERPLHLCALHRCVRMQPAPPGLLPHFRLFALLSAERKHADFRTLRQHLRVYLQALKALEAAGFRFHRLRVDVSDTRVIDERLATAGIDRERIRREVRTQVFADPDAFLASAGLPALRGSLSQIRGQVSALSPRSQRQLEALDAQVLSPLADEYPEVEVRFDLGRSEGLGYYTGPCLRVTAEDASHLRLPLVDGGYLDWTATLLGDPNERLLTTGIGPDLAALRFRAAAMKPSPAPTSQDPGEPHVAE